MKKMQSNQNYKKIVQLLLDSRYLKPSNFYESLDKGVSKVVGHKLFTLMVIDKSRKYVERVYSSNKKIYPLLGTKPIPKNAWTKRVLIEKKEFLGTNFTQIKKLFFDYEIIKSIGCGSIINLLISSLDIFTQFIKRAITIEDNSQRLSLINIFPS